MDANRLSQIETLWSMVYHAHSVGDPGRVKAQHKLLARYGPAIQRYLHGAFRDEVAADDAYQDFAVKFLRGEYGSAHEEKGRFRNFLKVVLGRIVADYYRGKQRRPTTQLDSHAAISVDSEQRRRERDFLNEWRDQLLSAAWGLLAEGERRTGRPWMTLLKLRVENPELRSSGLAEALGERLGESVSVTHVRVLLHRAREKFSHFLTRSVAETLADDSLEAVEEELAQLELLQYCQAWLEQRKAARRSNAIQPAEKSGSA